MALLAAATMQSSMELDEQELPATQAFEVFMGKVYSASSPRLKLKDTLISGHVSQQTLL
jgi:hypothetical protein